MTSVSMFDAKTNLSKYVSYLTTGQEPFIIILRNGIPVAKMVPFDSPVNSRIGIAKGKLPAMPSLEEFNSVDVASDFYAGGDLI